MMMTRLDAAAFLKARDHFSILTHRRPDGDTLGSAALLCRGLRQAGKTAHIIENPEITQRYLPLHQGLTKGVCEEDDTIICVDVAAKIMLPDTFAPYAHKIALRIDHHAAAESFGALEVVEPDTAACGEIVFGILAEIGVPLDEPMADALYTAISTDTGCFRYANTTADTFLVAAECAKVSKNLPELNRELFDTRSLGRLRLEGWLVEHMRFLKDGAAAICALPKSVEEKLRLSEDDLENISGFPRSIQGVKVAATLREEKDGRIKLSVRAVPGYDAAAICASFGGGGHKGAAGATFACSLEEAAKLVENTVETVI